MPLIRPRAVLTDADSPGDGFDFDAAGAGGAPAAQPATNGAGEYLGRLVAYIPAEAITVHQAILGFLPAEPDGRAPALMAWVGFALLAVTPVWLYFMTKEGEQRPVWHQILISTLAFAVWLLAVENPLAHGVSTRLGFEWHRSYGSIAMVACGVILFPLIERVFLTFASRRGGP